MEVVQSARSSEAFPGYDSSLSRCDKQIDDKAKVCLVIQTALATRSCSRRTFGCSLPWLLRKSLDCFFFLLPLVALVWMQES